MLSMHVTIILSFLFRIFFQFHFVMKYSNTPKIGEKNIPTNIDSCRCWWSIDLCSMHKKSKSTLSKSMNCSFLGCVQKCQSNCRFQYSSMERIATNTRNDVNTTDCCIVNSHYCSQSATQVQCN